MLNYKRNGSHLVVCAASHNPELLEVSSFMPLVETAQLISYSEAFQSQDGPVTFPGPIALESIDVVPKHEDNAFS